MLLEKAKFCIFGSCVTRDIFGEDLAGTVAVYLARSSLGAQMGEAIANERVAAAVSSQFQRRMVLGDMENTLWSVIRSDRSDLMILDFIDDRFDILRAPNGALHTVSSEYLAASKALMLPSIPPSDVISWNSPEKMELWKSGWMKLCAMLDAEGRLDRLVVNRVFWADRLADGTMLHNGNVSYIKRANDFLHQIYEYIDLVQPGCSALRYDSALFRADPAHRWGLSAFHYIPELYISAREQLKLMLTSSPA